MKQEKHILLTKMKKKRLYVSPVSEPIDAEGEPLMDLSNAQVPEGTHEIEVDNDPTDAPAGAKTGRRNSVWDD